MNDGHDLYRQNSSKQFQESKQFQDKKETYLIQKKEKDFSTLKCNLKATYTINTNGGKGNYETLPSFARPMLAYCAKSREKAKKV